MAIDTKIVFDKIRKQIKAYKLLEKDLSDRALRDVFYTIIINIEGVIDGAEKPNKIKKTKK